MLCGVSCACAHAKVCGQVDEREVVDLIEQREEARKNRDFGTADTLRDVLQQDFGVAVDDDTREWWVGQRQVCDLLLCPSPNPRPQP
jgi:cysteinyl-tRNA synthetase